MPPPPSLSPPPLDSIKYRWDSSVVVNVPMATTVPLRFRFIVEPRCKLAVRISSDGVAQSAWVVHASILVKDFSPADPFAFAFIITRSSKLRTFSNKSHSRVRSIERERERERSLMVVLLLRPTYIQGGEAPPSRSSRVSSKLHLPNYADMLHSDDS